MNCRLEYNIGDTQLFIFFLLHLLWCVCKLEVRYYPFTYIFYFILFWEIDICFLKIFLFLCEKLLIKIKTFI